MTKGEAGISLTPLGSHIQSGSTFQQNQNVQINKFAMKKQINQIHILYTGSTFYPINQPITSRDILEKFETQLPLVLCISWNRIGENASWNSTPANRIEISGLILGTQVQPIFPHCNFAFPNQSRMSRNHPRTSKNHAFGKFFVNIWHSCNYNHAFRKSCIEPVRFPMDQPNIKLTKNCRYVQEVLSNRWTSGET